MARLAYCRQCKATYPLSIVVSDGGRSGKIKAPTCPMGHLDLEELDTVQRPRGKK